jgi:hypothetical protein
MNQYNDTALTFSYTINFDYIMLKITSTVAQQNTVGHWILIKNEICLPNNDGFDKTDILHLAPWYTYWYSPRDTTYTVLVRETVPLNY